MRLVPEVKTAAQYKNHSVWGLLGQNPYLFNNAVAMKGGDGTQEGIGTTLNLSASGMLIESTVPLKVDEGICFSLQLPDTLVIGSGRLVWQILSSRYGIQFQSLQEDGKQHIKKFIVSANESLGSKMDAANSPPTASVISNES